MKRVLVVGSAVVDLVLQSSGLKVMKSHQVDGGVGMCEVYGGKLIAENASFLTGGAGSNVAVGLRRLGLLSVVLVRVGSDDLGKMIVSELDGEGVVVENIQFDRKETTGVSSVLVANDGGRSIITYRGASAKLSSAEVEWPSLLESVDWVQVSSTGGNMEFIEDVVSWSVANGIRVGLSPGKEEMKHIQKLKRIIKKVEFVSMNRSEAAMFSGLERSVSLNTLFRSFLSLGVSVVAITQGRDGASVVFEDRIWHLDAYSVKTVDETGSGDAFVSGMVSGLAAKLNIEDCLRRGIANGASVVGKPGAKEGLLRNRTMGKWLNKKSMVVEEAF